MKTKIPILSGLCHRSSYIIYYIYNKVCIVFVKRTDKIGRNFQNFKFQKYNLYKYQKVKIFVNTNFQRTYK